MRGDLRRRCRGYGLDAVEEDVRKAMEKIDKYLDSALVSGLTQIYVIHGKGTGTLRKVISEYLKKHSAVKSFRLGDWNEGGAGVTIVQLK